MPSTKNALRLAVLAALVGAVLLRAYMRRFEAERSGGPARPVLSLARDAREGTTLERSLLSVRELPESYVESRHIPARDLERVLGTRLATSARAGEALLWTDIAELGAPVRKLATLVPPGMRAITIAPRAVRGGRLLHPGDRIDVLFTVRSASDAARTRSLLQSVLVLAVGTDTGDPDGTHGAGDSRELTLGVDPASAQLLAHAEAQGELRVVLRHPDDAQILDGLPDTTSLVAPALATPTPFARGDAP